MTKFTGSLSSGKKAERFILKKVQAKYPKAYIKDGYCKEYDIVVPEISEFVEVKSEAKTSETGNIAIEIQNNGQPSGIKATTAKYWAHVFQDADGEWFYVFTETKKMLKHAETYGTLKYGGDMANKMYIVSIDTLPRSFEVFPA